MPQQLRGSTQLSRLQISPEETHWLMMVASDRVCEITALSDRKEFGASLGQSPSLSEPWGKPGGVTNRRPRQLADRSKKPPNEIRTLDQP